ALTAADSEPEALIGLAEIAASGQLLHQVAETTIGFGHRETRAGRILTFEAAGAPLSLSAEQVDRLRPAAVLLAPVAAEIGAATLTSSAGSGWRPLRAAILQGWLRLLEAGKVVRPLPFSGLPPELIAALAELAVLVASREDLLADATHPQAQLAALRSAIGPGPILVVTDGVEGAWFDVEETIGHVPVAFRVDRVPTVGAGDAYAAILAVRLATGSAQLRDAMTDAAQAVAEILAARRRA
ncbi:MAG: PfkB family carbohydrate kinase, partial [Chloroflexota bacterium]|nr:PfkB family carbohydrate kinase [Chloroflexota bacterium]